MISSLTSRQVAGTPVCSSKRVQQLKFFKSGIHCSSVLPIPYAFSRLGVLYGLLTQLVVAICNATASVLLLDAASEVGHSSYEGVAEAIGGKTWKLLTQVLRILQ